MSGADLDFLVAREEECFEYQCQTPFCRGERPAISGPDKEYDATRY